MPQLSRGVLVAIEGIDGSGKSTQVAAIARTLTNAGIETICTREPTAGQYGLELRRSAREGRLSPERELELFMLDREEHVRTVIEPALASGKVVLTDRYYFSTVAYQGARGFSQEKLLRDNEVIAPRPDLLVILDVDVEIALARIRTGRQEVPNAFEEREMLSICRGIFLDLATSVGGKVVAGMREEVIIARDILVHLVDGPLGARIDSSMPAESARSLRAQLTTGP